MTPNLLFEWLVLFVFCLRTLYPSQGHEVIMLYSSIFVAVGVICRSVIHFELAFVYGVR